MNERKAVNVGELIEMLKDLPASTRVLTEGCDCWGDVCDLRVEDDYVLLRRTDTSERVQ